MCYDRGTKGQKHRKNRKRPGEEKDASATGDMSFFLFMVFR